MSTTRPPLQLFHGMYPYSTQLLASTLGGLIVVRFISAIYDRQIAVYFPILLLCVQLAPLFALVHVANVNALVYADTGHYMIDERHVRIALKVYTFLILMLPVG